MERSRVGDQRIVYTCDTHEYRSGIPDILKDRGHEVHRDTLYIGDYALSKSYIVKGVVEIPVKRIVTVIERKAKDTVKSIIERLCNEQLYRMGMSYWHSFLIVEGNMQTLAVERHFPYETIRKNIVKAAIKRAPAGQQGAISVLQSYDKYDTVGLLTDIGDSIKNTEDLYRMPQILAPKIGNVPNMRVKAILAAHPDIGPHRAHLLLNKFGSIAKVYRANEEDMLSIKGIGQKTIDKFVKIINYEYKNN